MLGVALFTLAVAQAASTGPTFAVGYDAPPDCPNQATFEAAILARVAHARRAAVNEAPQIRFEAELRTEAGSKPRLRIILADGTAQDREIADDTCTSAVQSMAIIAAMVLEAQAAAEPPPAVAEPAPPPPVPALNAETQPPSTIPPPSAQPSRPTWLRLGASGVAEGAAAPSPAWGGALHGELGSQTSGVLAPSIRVSALYARAAIVETAAGDARFQLALGRAQLCWLRWGTAAAQVRWCALAEAGMLAARGINALKPRSQSMLWLGVGLGAVFEQRLDARSSLELGASARALPVHDEFVFAPSTTIHQVPIVTWDFSVGVSYRLW